MIEIDAVTKNAMNQGVVSSADENDSTDLERTDLDSHEKMVVLGRNCYIVNRSRRIAEVHPYSP